MWMYVMS